MSPTPDELLRRLRAVYCRHKAISYEEFDNRVGREAITWQELQELVEVLFGEINNVGLYDFLFREEREERERVKARIAEVEGTIKKIGSMVRSNRAMAARYAGVLEELKVEGNALKQRLKE